MSRAPGLVVAMLLSGCFLDEVDLESKRCPCAIGWFCDPATNTCTLTVPRDAGFDAGDAGRVTDGGRDGGFDDAGDAGSPTDGGRDAGRLDYAEVVLADSPVGYWRFDDTAGSVTAADSSTHDNDGTYRGGVTLGVEGAIAGNTAVQLNGTDARIDFGDRFDFVGKAPFTLEAWFRPDLLDESHRRLFDKTSIEGLRQGYTVFVRQAGMIDGGMRSTMALERWRDQDLPGAPTTTLAFPLDRFTHVAIVYDGTRGSIYVDGVLAADQFSEATLLDHTGPFVVGSQSNQSLSFFDGVVDEVAVYDYALPAERIRAHHAAGSGS